MMKPSALDNPRLDPLLPRSAPSGAVGYSPATFYHPGRSSGPEGERLRTMAPLGDLVSLKALGGQVDRTGVVVADLGAGDSASLGSALTARNPSLRYLPIDIRSEAIQGHRAEGFDGTVAPVTDLPLRDGSVDVVHARFLFGWLDDAGAGRALEEAARVTRDHARLVVIDYDWNTAVGAPVVVAWKDDLLELLTTFGFDPGYGRKHAVELVRHLSAAGLQAADYAISQLRTSRTVSLREALPTLEALVEPVVRHVAALGLDDRAARLRGHFVAVADLSEQEPEQSVTYPAIVATVVDLSRRSTGAGRPAAARRGADRRAGVIRGLVPAGPAGLGVFRLESRELTEQARRLQAAVYVRHGYHTRDSTDADGFLIDEIDPPEVVARSSYLGIVDRDGEVGACVRMIEALENNLVTLPTLAKMSDQRRVGRHQTVSVPFPEGSVVFEVSGLAKSSRAPDPTVTTRLLLAVVSEARRRGEDFAVMGLVEPAASLLLTAYGRQAIRPLDVPRVHVHGAGVRSTGLTLVPCYTEAVTFVDDILAHCRTLPDRFNRLTVPLCELTAAAFSDDPARAS